MDELGILITHGDVVWKTALLVLVLGGALVVPALWKRVRWERSARRERRRLGEATGEPEEGERAVVEGRLRAEGAVRRIEDGADAAAVSLEGEPRLPQGTGFRAHARADRLVVEGDAGRVVLDGAVDVRVGAREDHPRTRLLRLPNEVEERTREIAPVVWKMDLLTFRSVADGDRVRVKGVANKAPDSGAGYRDEAAAWFLRPLPAEDRSIDDDAVPLVATGWARLTGPYWKARVRGALWGGALFLLLFGLGGKVAGDNAGDSVISARLAAATPFHREDGLRGHRDHLEERLGAGESFAEAFAETSRLAGQRCWAGWSLLRAGHLDLAEQLSTECGDYHDLERIAEERAREGRLGEASRVAAVARGIREREMGEPAMAGLGAWSERLPLHLLAGDHRAAIASARLAMTYEEAQERTGDMRDFYVKRVARARCLVLALEHRTGGGDELLAELDRMARESAAGEACALLLADLLEGEDRLAVLERCASCASEYPTTKPTWLLRYGASGCIEGPAEVARCESLVGSAPFDVHPMDALLRHPREGVRMALPAVEADLLERLDAEDGLAPQARVARAFLLSSLATFHAVTASPSRAEELAERARREWEAIDGLGHPAPPEPGADGDVGDGDGDGGVAADAEAPADGTGRPVVGAGRRAASMRWLLAALAFRQGRFDEARRLAGEGTPIRAEIDLAAGDVPAPGAAAAEILPATTEQQLAASRAVQAVLVGDAEPILELEHGPPPYAVTLVARRLDEDARGALRERFEIDPVHPNMDPRYNVAELAPQLLALESLGDDARAARVRAQLDALREALLRRSTIVPIYILEE